MSHGLSLVCVWRQSWSNDDLMQIKRVFMCPSVRQPAVSGSRPVGRVTKRHKPFFAFFFYLFKSDDVEIRRGDFLEGQL